MHYFKYLKYILIHKYWVAVGLWKIFKYDPCLKNLPLLWLMITHDLSKFTFEEFFPYANFFYRKWKNKKSDEYLTAKIKWEHAWNHHQNCNKHHWGYWKLIQWNGNIKDIGFFKSIYCYEMVADWYGASMAKDNGNIIKWYQENEQFMKLHPFTEYWVHKALYNINWS